MMMFIFPLTLPETAGTFVGLETQGLIREQLGPVPLLVILSGAAYLVVQVIRHGGGWVNLFIYLPAAFLVLTLTWPTEEVSPDAVVSQAADGTLTTANDILTGQGNAVVPKAMVAYLKVVTRGWVTIAQQINVEGLEPFREVAPISWLVEQRLDADLIKSIRNWTSSCVTPARVRVLQETPNLGFDELQPFSGSTLYTAMGSLTIRVAGDPVLGFVSVSNISCAAYGDRIVSAVTDHVTALATPGGNTMVTVWQDELGVGADEVVKFLIHQEVTRASGPAIPAPSVLGLYGTIRVLRSLGGGIGNMLSGALSLNPGQIAEGAGSVLSGGGKDLINDLTLSLQNIAGRAVFVTRFSADIIAVLQAVILSVFPLIVLFALIPGHHLRPLVVYAYILIAIYSMPFAWALIDRLGDIAGFRTGTSFMYTNPVAFLQAVGSQLVVITIGTWVALVGIMVAILIPVGGAGIAIVRSVRGL
jgi:hypothetical protein